MKKQAILGMLFVGSLLLLPLSASGQDLFDTMSDRDLSRLLKDMDFEGVESHVINDELTRFDVDGGGIFQFSVYNYRGSHDLSLWMYIVNDEGVTRSTLLKINEWNRDGRWTKAYLDSDGDWVLEADFDVAPGVTKNQVEDWIMLWLSFVDDYAEFVEE